MSKPKITALAVNYSVGAKANLGNYESGDIHFSRSETWDVQSMTQAEVDDFYGERLAAIAVELDELVLQGYKEMKSS